MKNTFKKGVCLALAMLLSAFAFTACTEGGTPSKADMEAISSVEAAWKSGNMENPGTDAPETEAEVTLPAETMPEPELAVGATLFFGAYEQDKNWENGREPLEWIVLESDASSALLITKYCLASSNYRNSASMETCGWDMSTIRQILNSDFYNRVFSSGERSKILSVTHYPEGNPVTKENPGETVEDKVFVLSASEAERLLPEATDRVAESTPFARSFSLITENYPSSGKYAAWWLRNPSHDTVGSFVNGKGEFVYDWDSTALYSVCIRPCIRIAFPLETSKTSEDGLVTEVKHIEASFEAPHERVSRYISIPQVNIDSADVKALNETMARLWNEEWSPTTVDYEVPRTVDYKYYVNGDVLSIVVWDDAGSADFEYLVQSIRISDGSLIDSTKIPELFGISKELLNEACRKAVRAYYEGRIAEADESNASMIQMCMEWALNREFNEYGALYYLGEDGILQGVFSTDWWAGSGMVRYDRVIAYSNRSNVQDNAALLFDKLEAEGGEVALARLAYYADAYRKAAKWAYNRVVVKEGLQESEAVMLGGAFTIGEFLVTGDINKDFLKDVLADSLNDFAAQLAETNLTSPNELFYDLLRKTDAAKFEKISNLHANYKKESASDAEARQYIEAYYAAEIDYATILMSYMFFSSQVADEMSDYVEYAKDAAYGAVQDYIISKLTDGFTVPSAFSDNVGEQVVLKYLNFLRGDTDAFLDYAMHSGYDPVERWGVIVSSYLKEVRIAEQ